MRGYELRRLKHARTLPDHAPALDAVGAGFDPAAHAVDDGVDHLNVWPEYSRCHRRDVLTDAARFLRLAAPQDVISTDLALATNFTTSRHDDLLHSYCEPQTIAKESRRRKGILLTDGATGG